MNFRTLKPLSLALAVSVALAACQKAETPADTAVAEPARPAIDLASLKTPVSSLQAADLDTSVSACTDLDQFVNAKWLAANPVPADRTTWGSFELLADRSLEIQRALVENLAATNADTGTAKLIGDVWATGMDEAGIEAAGLAPIQSILDSIAALDSGDAVAEWLRGNYAKGQGYVFGFGPSPDFANSSMNIAYAGQGGLGLPDKGYYFDDQHAGIREAYVAHVAKVLELAGADAATAAAQAAEVMAFETRLAKVSMSSEELSRDVSKYYNPVSLADADAISPNFPWSKFFDSQGIAAPAMFSLAQPDFHKEVSSMLADVPVATWQAYLRYQAIDSAAPFLASAYAEENFNFYGRTLRGQQEMQPRWKRVLNTINGQMGEALGQEYVQVAFSPEAKERMQQLVGNLSEALKARIEGLEWMGEDTKAKALEKWAAFTPKIGYPDKWRDWSGLQTGRDSYVANLMAANEFNYRFNLAKIGQPVDKTEWQMSPQTVNAYYNPLANEIVFPAAILQPPFFDLQADDALNYGGIGAVIGHEMIHGYDDQGSRFGASGNFENWWSDKDKAGFEERTGKLVAQFDEYVAIDDLHVNGKLTLGENIADLGGLAVAYDALQRELATKKVGEIDGYTQDQRFFMNWATVWRRNFKPEELKVRLQTDPHAPARFRAIGAPSNLPTFAAAFGCQAGDPMVRPADKQVAIW
ncbi:M13 family metallopeptidase [Arenimonas caeni]|uniref:Peptidase n=1 Tax=Arenimonas caeni TaxID=2058085 RepID=A0A2P6MCR1_9GAMM|nr:M13 family metallopeptidase [Arenimonas caeni]MDY0021539.1 M13 family metallopeptidase [Arenimonas caeni]PRH83777.1 peptidase [Arenimonas caeni]